jgi:hypothetical protein
MKYSSLFLAAVAVMSAQSVYASPSILALTPGSTAINNVNVASAAQVTVDGRTSSLELVGAGERKYSMFGIVLKFYVAQFFVDNLKDFDRTDSSDINQTNSLGSLETMHTVAIRLNFLQKLSGGQIQGAFKAALHDNKEDSPKLEEFLKQIEENGGVAAGETLTFVGEVLPDGTNVMTFEDANGASHPSVKSTTDTHFVRDFFKIWLGSVGNDKRLGETKQEICSGNGISINK